MAESELVFAPLGGVGEIGMNLSIYGVGDGRAAQMAHRRLWRVLRGRRAFARRRSHPAGHPLSDRGAAQHRRPRPHPRPRGPYGRAHRPVAASQCAALCHAVYGGAVRGPPPVRARRAENPDQCRAARRPAGARPVRDRVDQRRAFDPRIQRARDPHPARDRGAYRRLEDRSHPACRLGHRRGEALRAGRRGRGRACGRLNKRNSRRPIAVGG